MASVPKSTINPERQVLYGRMDKHNLAPLWEVLHNLIPNEPATPCKPALWKYRDARPYLMEAGKLITAKEAVRRVLILENPGMRGESSSIVTSKAISRVLTRATARGQPLVVIAHNFTAEALKLLEAHGAVVFSRSDHFWSDASYAAIRR